MKQNLDILLLSMPVRCIDRPALSLPVLTSHLKKEGFDVEQMDNNMILQDKVLDGKVLEHIYMVILPLLMRMNQNCSKLYKKLSEFYQLLKTCEEKYGLKEVEYVKKEMQAHRYEDLVDRKILEVVQDIFRISGNLAFYFTTVTYYSDFYEKNKIEEIILGEIDILFQTIVKAKPLMVGFSVMEVQRTFSIWAAKKLREKYDGVILFGGSDLSLNKEKYLVENANIDFISWADGENTVSGLIQMLKSGEAAYENIPSLIYRKDNEIITTEYQGYPIEEYNIADYDGFPLDLYIFPSLQILTSKGCSWSKCKFCMHWNSYGQNFRQRSTKAVVDEIEYYVKKYNTRLFSIVDEAISANYGRELSEEIISRGLDIRWIQMSRLDSDFDEEVFEKMHQAGARFVEWGLETGSQKVLNDMCKGIDVKEVQRLIHESASVGIVNKMLMFHNYPTEDIDDLMKSIHIIKKNTYFHLIKPMLTLRHAFVLKLGSPLSEVAFNENWTQEKEKYFRKVWRPESVYNINAKYIGQENNGVIKQRLVNDYLKEMKGYLKERDAFITDNNNITMDLVLVDLVEKGYELPIDTYLPRKQGGVGDYVL